MIAVAAGVGCQSATFAAAPPERGTARGGAEMSECIYNGPTRPKSRIGLTPLAAAEVERVIKGRWIRYLDIDPQIADAKEGEEFLPDGSWYWLGGRGSIYGKYEFHGNILVVELLRGKYCRRIYMNNKGALYIDRFGSPLGVEDVVPLKISSEILR